MKKLLISSLKFFSLSAVKFFLLRLNTFTKFSYTSSVIISLEFVFLNFRLPFGENLLFCLSNRVLICAAPDHSPQQDALFALQRIAPFARTWTTTTDRQTSLLAGSDRHVLGVLPEAYPRARCHRDRDPRGTLARRTVGGSGAV